MKDEESSVDVWFLLVNDDVVVLFSLNEGVTVHIELVS